MLAKVAPPLKDEILRLCAYFLLRAKRGHAPLDPVARFHLANGARLARPVVSAPCHRLAGHHGADRVRAGHQPL